MQQESKILGDALRHWSDFTGIQIKPLEIEKREGVDAVLEFAYDGRSREISVQIRKELRTYQLAELRIIAKRKLPFMVIAEKLSSTIKGKLRESGIAYIELCGNMYYRDASLFVFADANKSPKSHYEKLGRAFTKTGLKVVFQFLIAPDMVNLSYRSIADMTGVRFGNINFIMTDLRQQGYLISIDSATCKLVRKNELLTQWMNAYDHKLKKSLLLGTLRFLEGNNLLQWEEVGLNTSKTCWGEEPGGDVLTNFLQPEILTLYTEEKLIELIKNYRMVPDPHGYIKVYQKFWKVEEEVPGAAPALLVYVDLMNTGDSRCAEVAGRDYEKYLKDLFV